MTFWGKYRIFFEKTDRMIGKSNRVKGIFYGSYASRGGSMEVICQCLVSSKLSLRKVFFKALNGTENLQKRLRSTQFSYRIQKSGA
jgi:hypothetical protein